MTDARVIVVTGGSRGLGEAFVQAYLDAGETVATCSRSRTPAVDAWEAAHGDQFSFDAFDICDRAAAAAFVNGVVERFGRIDVLVNNAGLASESLLALVDDDEADLVVDINLRATIHMTRLVVRKMLVHGGSHIVNISSIIGLSGYRGLSVYASTKAGLDGFTRAMARELGAKRITVNSIAPGYLRTDMTGDLAGDQLGQIERRTPLGRLGTPEDVVGALQFLTSPAGSFITGQVLVVDGGLTS